MDSVIGLGALIAAAVGIIKAAYPGTMPARGTLAVVGVVAAGAIALQAASGMLAGTPYEIVSLWVVQVTAAIGAREVAATAFPPITRLH